jgi:hypothetical protein
MLVKKVEYVGGLFELEVNLCVVIVCGLFELEVNLCVVIVCGLFELEVNLCVVIVCGLFEHTDSLPSQTDHILLQKSMTT